MHATITHSLTHKFHHNSSHTVIDTNNAVKLQIINHHLKRTSLHTRKTSDTTACACRKDNACLWWSHTCYLHGWNWDMPGGGVILPLRWLPTGVKKTVGIQGLTTFLDSFHHVRMLPLRRTLHPSGHVEALHLAPVTQNNRALTYDSRSMCMCICILFSSVADIMMHCVESVMTLLC